MDGKNTEGCLMAHFAMVLALCPGLDECGEECYKLLEGGSNLCEQRDTMRIDVNRCRGQQS